MDEKSDTPKPIESDIQPGEEAKGDSPGWWWDDSTPGTGERPDWLPEKYQKASDVAKAYVELQKKFGDAPETYDFSAGNDWIEPEYESIQEFADYAKSRRVPQEVIDKMLQSVGKYLGEFKVDYNEERKILGDDAESRLQVLNNWMKSNFSEDAYYALTNNMRTADTIKAIEEMRNKMIQNNTTIPTGNEVVGEPSSTVSDIQDEMSQNLERYQTDPKYRAEITKKIELALLHEKS